MRPHQAGSTESGSLTPERKGPSRPSFPTGYGIKQSKPGLLDWRWVDRRMGRARNYWIATTAARRRPHCMPVWGVWIDEVLYFCTDRNSKKSRNLAKRPAAVVHLESADEAVILEGTAAEMKAAATLKKVDQAYFAKYKIDFKSVPGDVVVFAVHPEVVFAWREKDFNRSASRWIIKK